ncbi:6434_t:CDS:1 [Paraglomus brasilianum]|uniref:6434_t:CDS:1 n=1 Tax=Paraglomus brasilianum TaxID=144538 RepID=A0A9N8WNQ5_9GLOM|nr:6434_t:CDS:1 [Paraglomus brasilianum]
MDFVDSESSYTPADLVSSHIITAANKFKTCSELAKNQDLIESIAEEVEDNRALFCKTVMASLFASTSMFKESFKMVARGELLGLLCTDIAPYRNAVETLLKFVRKNENIASDLETRFGGIYDRLKVYSNSIRDCLETLDDKKDELKRLQRGKNDTATKQLVGLGLGMVSLMSSILGPETMVVEGVSAVTGAIGVKTFIDASALIEQLRKEIRELEAQINSGKTIESLHEALKSATMGVGQVKDYWQKRGFEIEGLLKELDNYEQRGLRLNELEAWRFKTKWINYQKECEEYVEQLCKHIEEHVIVMF